MKRNYGGTAVAEDGRLDLLKTTAAADPGLTTTDQQTNAAAIAAIAAAPSTVDAAAAGDAPPQKQGTTSGSQSLAEEHHHVVTALEAIERELRLEHHPELLERAAPLEVDELREQQQQEQQQQGTTTATITAAPNGAMASLRRRGLREIPALPSILPPLLNLSTILELDASHNELSDLPGLEGLPSLTKLDLNRNWFNTLPEGIAALKHLTTLVLSRNFFKPSEASLRWNMLRKLPGLRTIDLRYNQKCCRPLHRDRIREALLPSRPAIEMTLWEEDAHGNNKNHSGDGTTASNYVGSSAAERDPRLLRSQLEPLGTVALRKRLVQDFGRPPSDPLLVDRAGVMKELLGAYRAEGLALAPSDGNANGNADALLANRRVLEVDGIPVPEARLEPLRAELRQWTAQTGKTNKNRERPSIRASNYMILRKPPAASIADDATAKLSRRALRKLQKRERYRKLWDLGIEALASVDPQYARNNCTEIAVTYGFSGSPHRDKQNCGPFYGLSLGDYNNSNHQGHILVEASARVVVAVNTKNRLGKVDGRYVHWVAPWGDNAAGIGDGGAAKQERYSLIYYETGHEFRPPGPAVFSVPGEQPPPPSMA